MPFPSPQVTVTLTAQQFAAGLRFLTQLQVLCKNQTSKFSIFPAFCPSPILSLSLKVSKRFTSPRSPGPRQRSVTAALGTVKRREAQPDGPRSHRQGPSSAPLPPCPAPAGPAPGDQRLPVRDRHQPLRIDRPSAEPCRRRLCRPWVRPAAALAARGSDTASPPTPSPGPVLVPARSAASVRRPVRSWPHAARPAATGGWRSTLPAPSPPAGPSARGRHKPGHVPAASSPPRPGPVAPPSPPVPGPGPPRPHRRHFRGCGQAGAAPPPRGPAPARAGS